MTLAPNEYQRIDTRIVSRASIDQDGPSMNIPTLPESIEWTKVAEFLTGLGIDLTNLSRDGVFIGWNSIECTVFAVNADGNRYLGRDNEVAAHRIHIPINHDGD